MKRIKLGSSSLSVPAIAVGCMRIDSMNDDNLAAHLTFCMENGLNFFDHADIYGNGICESKFGKALKIAGYNREDVILQSKCGIKPGTMYDLSKEHILTSVDKILTRLDTDYLDALVLHRPDALVDPEEVAEAFDTLESSGKVRQFGVSNHKPMQIELLKKYVKQPIIVNQLQLSLPFSNMIANGMEVNMQTEGAVERDGSVLDYCRLHDITIQAWSPFQYGFFEGVFIGNDEKFPELNETLTELADKYETTPTAIAAAWILRHPANIQLIAGTTNQKRMADIIRGNELQLSREEWYRLYLNSGHILP
ncbi:MULTISPECIES: aldo/keto reductase family oxidoreductase [unclassified Bacillus (in: firmicutes)]|uniref:aldo/keto reductase n=1 Tax=unclassified Bacillus (in: firmicutes) TaxID=185979 RepID=UPI0011205568|nr:MULTISPECIES: aldo/keto reductase [unclassified Bacillus (in: firmicutes)]